MARIVYSQEMARAIRRIKPPVNGLVMDIKALPEFLAVTVYEENIMEYDDSQREQIMQHLILVRDLIKSYGTPCHINGEQNMPRKSGS